MKTLSERLRGPIKHPQQLMSQRVEAADAIDELVAELNMVQAAVSLKGWDALSNQILSILAKHKEEK